MIRLSLGSMMNRLTVVSLAVAAWDDGSPAPKLSSAGLQMSWNLEDPGAGGAVRDDDDVADIQILSVVSTETSLHDFKLLNGPNLSGCSSPYWISLQMKVNSGVRERSGKVRLDAWGCDGALEVHNGRQPLKSVMEVSF